VTRDCNSVLSKPGNPEFFKIEKPALDLRLKPIFVYDFLTKVCKTLHIN
jgi:hypothetical protein